MYAYNRLQMSLREVLDRALLEQLADEASFKRGEDYARRGMVRTIDPTTHALDAMVDGTSPYHVRLWTKAGRVKNSCTYPVGQRDMFCKHCVAAALVWMSDGKTTESKAVVPGKSPIKSTGKPLDATALKKAFGKSANTGGYVEYREMPGYAAAIKRSINSFEKFLIQGHAEEVIGLAEYGLKRIEKAIEHVDDSDGYMSGILNQLQDLHLRACLIAKPEPVA